MHMADALVIPAVAGTMYACSTMAAGYSTKKIRLEEDTKKIPIMGVMGAFVFATQMVNFTIPGTGSSGHLCGGMLLSAILGPYAGFLTMIGVLLIQCLMFADGGILALGCNVWNMAFYGCFIGSIFIWKPMMKSGISKKKIVIASIVGCMLTLQMGSFSVVLETMASGVTELPFSSFVMMMQPIHLAIGFVEGLITAAVLCFVYEARPELLCHAKGSDPVGKSKKSLRQVILILGIVSVFVAGGASLMASSNPDVFECSIQKITGNTEIQTSDTFYQQFANVQEATAIMPDYEVEGISSQAGTSMAGITGGLLVVGICLGGSLLIRGFRKKKSNE